MTGLGLGLGLGLGTGIGVVGGVDLTLAALFDPDSPEFDFAEQYAQSVMEAQVRRRAALLFSYSARYLIPHCSSHPPRPPQLHQQSLAGCHWLLVWVGSTP